MIYRVDNEFVISSHGVWRPGVFDTKKAGHYARLFTDERINRLTELSKNRVITFEMLKEDYPNRKEYNLYSY